MHRRTFEAIAGWLIGRDVHRTHDLSGRGDQWCITRTGSADSPAGESDSPRPARQGLSMGGAGGRSAPGGFGCRFGGGLPRRSV